MAKNINPYKNLIEYQLEIGIGNVKGFNWISVQASKGGVYGAPWMLVPEKIESYNDLLTVINQLSFSSQANERAKEYNFPNPKKVRHLLFAYFLGVLIGDVSKPTERRENVATRRIGLTLTKKYKSNERFGEFVCFCANLLGLRMNRIKDLRKGRRNTYPFYRWNSEKSPLIQWMFNVCLGLRDDQVTTYNAVNLDWIFSAPKEFRIWFLQGLADSDGYVDFNSFQVGIISTPNTDLIRKLIESLSIKHSVKIFKKTI